ncbi:MAG: hypothetical protein LBT76_04330, partial [Tannerella sp.]|nr:hypothetical protein [Tannerella sp.]
MYLILLLFGGTILPNTAEAQGQTEFWFVAPHMSETVAADIKLDRPTFIALTNVSDATANVTIRLYNGGNTIDINRTIAPHAFYKHDFETENDIRMTQNPRDSAGMVTTRGIQIISDVNITAYYMHNHPASRDIFILKGKQAVGTS